jgi:hypothetical protein
MTNEEKLQHLLFAMSIMIPLRDTLERITVEVGNAVKNIEDKNVDALGDDIKMIGMLSALVMTTYEEEYGKDLKKSKDILDVEARLNKIFKRK